MATIFSIAPYKFLPPTTGGHWGIVNSDKVLSVYNEVHTITTDNNVFLPEAYPFRVHGILGRSKLRYLPCNYYRKTYRLARQLEPRYIICHHPYLFPLAAKLARKLNIPFYIRSYNIEAERFKSIGKWWWPLMQKFERSAFLRSDGVFFITAEDRAWAIEHYGLAAAKAFVMPFGTDFKTPPALPAIEKNELAASMGMDPGIPWLFFMGKLDYPPNEDAVTFIVRELFPLLQQRLKHFHILVWGKDLQEQLQREIAATNGVIRYLGFVPEMAPLIAACDVMINPVISGGGVKSKVVESLAWNKTVVSAYSGAIGIEKEVCGNKLLTAPDRDWAAFADLIPVALAHSREQLPDAFFDYYYLGRIAQRLQPHFAGKDK